MDEFKIAKLAAIQLKTALSVSIIRNKPLDLNIDEYIQVLRLKFYDVFENHHVEIDSLKRQLLEAKKEIFYLKNSNVDIQPTPSNSDSNSTTILKSSGNNSVAAAAKFDKLVDSLNSNVAFLSNVIKLKSVEKNMKSCESSTIKEEELFDWLKVLLEQIDECLKFERTKSSSYFTFPLASILHALQVFLNVYQIEWLYHLRSRLIDRLWKFIDDLVRFSLEYDPDNKKSQEKSVCVRQMLIAISTSDYLLNPVLGSIIVNLQIVTDYLCEPVGQKSPLEIESITSDCVQLCTCAQSILKIRLLDNYNPLTVQIQEQLSKFLNLVFINLTECYPLIAIEFSKLIQLLAFNNPN